MKPFLILILLTISINIFSLDEPFVEIYQTHDNGLYGRSEDRDMLLSIKESVFVRFETLKAEQEYNFLTGVVLSSTTVNNLESMLQGKNSVQVGFIKISKFENVYTIEDDNLFLSFSFSVEKPTDEIISVIENHYKNLPEVLESVKNHYLENYVIRIHSAENILRPEAKEITYDEALIMATIIGDKEQWLWGIHNGRDYLKELLF
ncbi:hypothetical protein EW093_09185 [Thiospirochaeta perfilievii]|uniref:Uncharacterized protein n=1 Tax=Thiospirochaeta perfilievii TaxID=252967 RepID=A0A5C1QCT6_9SPIO|nr:hypothetical protein [Thiospirochaeta perfilievii]QEN04870.1 hypothetical protein EW093_09185 [Thiospirochaeta perfilievii]